VNLEDPEVARLASGHAGVSGGGIRQGLEPRDPSIQSASRTAAEPGRHPHGQCRGRPPGPGDSGGLPAPRLLL